MGKVTDPDVLAQLEGGSGKVADPALLAQLEGSPAGAVPMSESAARGAKQGLTLGWGDEGAGALAAAMPFLDREAAGAGQSFGERYQHARDFYRGRDAAAKEAHPAIYKTSDVAGAIPMALLPVGRAAKGANLLQKSLAAGRAGATFGAIAGAGNSDAEDLSGNIKDTLRGFEGGGAIGMGLPLALGGLGLGAERASRWLGEKAVTMGRRALSGVGSSLSARRPIPAEAVQQALDTGAIAPMGTVGGTAARLGSAAEDLGDQYGAILNGLEARGVTGPNAVLLAKDLSQQAAQAAHTSLQSVRPTMLQAAADELPSKVSQVPFAPKELGLSQAEQIKRGLQDEARREYDKISRQYTTAGETKKEIASTMRAAIEDAVSSQASKAPEEAAAFLPVKAELSRTLEALKAAEEGSARAARRKPVGLQSTILGSAVGASHGALPGALAALGHQVLDERLPSTLAWAANKGANALGGAHPWALPLAVPTASNLQGPQAGAELAAFLRSLSGPRLQSVGADEDATPASGGRTR